MSECPARESGAQQDAVAGDEPAVLGETSVPRNEIAGGYAIAVGENDVIRLCRRNGPVANGSGAETAVLVPDVAHAHGQARPATIRRRAASPSLIRRPR